MVRRNHHLWPELDDLVDVIEVEPQTLWVDSLSTELPWRVHHSVLDELAARHQPVLAHRVGFPVAGVQAPNPAGVELFADCARRLGAVMASEHLAFDEAVIGNRRWRPGTTCLLIRPPRWCGRRPHTSRATSGASGVIAEALRLEAAALDCLIDDPEKSLLRRIDSRALRDILSAGQLPELGAKNATR